MSQKIITLTTDFGEKSGYVGVMKGVILSLNPSALLVDLSHQVTPQNIREGAFLLHTTYNHFPPGTLHLAVVDPGVGTERRGITIQVPEVGYFVGPDNGLFSSIIQAYPNLTAREITNRAFMREPVSYTFHGRDIFAPTTALLSRGEDFEGLGSTIPREQLMVLKNLWASWQPGNTARTSLILAQVVHVDHFGNLITNVPRSLFETLNTAQIEKANIQVGSFYTITGIVDTYAQAISNEPIALFSSSSLLEIARVNSRADTISGQSSPGRIIVGQEVKITVEF